MRALIIDDSRATRNLLGRILQEIGFETFEAANGSDALAALRAEGPPELALVDWNMPVMDGYAFVCAVREEPLYDDTRLMMVTTETGLEDVQRALMAGADEYVMKPFTREIIIEKLGLMGIEAQRTSP